jgi:hypothetical protein
VIASLGTGLLLTLLVTFGMRQQWGDAALLPGVAFGILATLIQVVAVRALGRRMHDSTAEFFKGFGVGMLLRMGGVGLFIGAVLLDRGRFPPLPTAFGYLGVLIPLLFLEARFVR